jgi:molecular chaperone DnaJ
MNISEAYKLLEINQNCSDDELKAQYKNLDKLYHPDIYKTDPNKFKEINAAYQMICDHRENPHKNNPFAGGRSPFTTVNISDIFSQFGFDQDNSAQFNHRPPIVDIRLSFKESVIGATKKINFKRYTKCNDCGGKGLDRKKNGCDQCDGFGRVIKVQGPMHFSSSCTKCYGKNVKTSKCGHCAGKGCLSVDMEENINIPPGIHDGIQLRAPTIGHFVGNNPFGGDQYGHVDIRVKVDKDNFLILEDRDVILNIKISLLDVLTGVEKEVNTINGFERIKIKPLSKNKDEVIIKDGGVPAMPGHKAGVQRVILNVEYPTDPTNLIKALKEEMN